MQIDLNTANMRDVIAESFRMHPSLLRDALLDAARVHAAARDTFVGSMKTIAHAAAQGAVANCCEAVAFLDAGELERFNSDHLGATVQAFTCAAKLLCVPRSLWADIANRAL